MAVTLPGACCHDRPAGGALSQTTVPLGSRLTFSVVLERQIKNLLDIRLCANLEDGSVAAEATGRMMIINR